MDKPQSNFNDKAAKALEKILEIHFARARKKLQPIASSKTMKYWKIPKSIMPYLMRVGSKSCYF